MAEGSERDSEPLFSAGGEDANQSDKPNYFSVHKLASWTISECTQENGLSVDQGHS